MSSSPDEAHSTCGAEPAAAPANLGAFMVLLSNQFRDGTDKISLPVTLLVIALAPIARLFESAPPAAVPSPGVVRLRRVGLVATAFVAAPESSRAVGPGVR